MSGLRGRGRLLGRKGTDIEDTLMDMDIPTEWELEDRRLRPFVPRSDTEFNPSNNAIQSPIRTHDCEANKIPDPSIPWIKPSQYTS